MRNYMNKKERETIEVAAIAASKLQDLIDGSGQHMAPDERKYLKMSVSFFFKYLSAAMIRTGAGKTFMNDIEQSELRLTSKGPARPDGQVVEMRQGDLYDLAELALAGNCVNCRINNSGCKLKQIMLELGIPEADQDNPVCPYQQ